MPQAAPTDDLFARMAVKVQDTFAERDPVAGRIDEAAVVIKVKGKADEKRSATLSEYEFERVQYDDLGHEVKEYRDTLKLTLYDGPIPADATVQADKYGKPDWHIEQRLPGDAGGMVQYRLRRGRPYAKQKPGLDAAGR